MGIYNSVSHSQPPFYRRDVAEMYDGILHKALQIPPGKSDAVCHLLHGLLQKDQHRRLGAIADFVSKHLHEAPRNLRPAEAEGGFHTVNGEP